MNVAIFTFSGTGNTYIAADFISVRLEELGLKVLQYKIDEERKKDVPPDLSAADYILIGYPIHAFNPPQMVAEFVRTFPEAQGMPVSIFKTAGEPFCLNRSSSHQIMRILKRKGYDVMAEKHMLMPYNMLFRYDDSLAKQMYLFTQKLAGEFALTVAEGKRELIKYNTFNKVMSFIFRIEWPGARLNGLFYSVSKKKCVMCMKCVKACPTQNIKEKNGKLKFSSNCAMCMRCVQVCPKEAVRIGLVQPLIVKRGYDFKKILSDDSISSEYVNRDTRGYFRGFRKFFGVE